MMTNSKTDERGALFVTADSEDPRFNEPYIDVREWRDEPADAPVFAGGITTQQGGAAPVKARHLYVHGGFTGTDAKFSFCFPPEEEYQGRFFQATHQLLAGEEATARNVAFALASGGYSVQTNMGGSDNPRSAEGSARGQSDTTIRGYRVNAEAAKFSRVVAAEIYGPHRTYGYLYGGSGGAYQTVTSAEMTTGVWDGFVPYVMGSPQSIPNCFTVRVNALRVLKDKWPSIIDAIEPGGSGDPYAGLNDEERTALEEATRTGFPPGAWFNYVPQGGGPLVLVASYVPVLDPTYLDDFWSKPGYLGTDPTSSVRAARATRGDRRGGRPGRTPATRAVQRPHGRSHGRRRGHQQRRRRGQDRLTRSHRLGRQGSYRPRIRTGRRHGRHHGRPRRPRQHPAR